MQRPRVNIRSKRESSRGPLIWSICWLASLFGCASILAGVTDPPADHTLTETVVVLERAINALATSSTEYRKTLQETLATLPRNSQEFVKADITTFLRRAPDERADFKCGAEFVRYRARKELLRIKDTLLHTNPQPAQPQFCYAVPFAIDPAQPINPIEIYGYDFDRVPLQILLMDSYGFRDVSFALIKRTHYHVTLNLAKNGVTFSPKNQVLAVTWGHLIQHSIPVIQPNTSLCSSRVEEIPAGKEISYAPLPISGDRYFMAAGAKILANATLDYESNKVDATVCMTAVEQNSDPNGVSGCAVEFVYTSEPEREIEWVFGDLEARMAYPHSNWTTRVQKGAQSGPVDQWTFTGFGAKSPANTEAQITVRLRKLRVVSTKTDGCVSAITYLEAKRTNALSAATVRRLDPELKKIDAAILKLRPRFAAIESRRYEANSKDRSHFDAWQLRFIFQDQ
jgi:hypothetical protein